MSHLDQGDQPATPADVDDLCRRATWPPPQRDDGYRPTASQVRFFTHLWFSKKQARSARKRDAPPEEDKRLPTVSAVAGQICHIANHLKEWGPVVSALKGKDEQEWELLRIQMERELRRFNCPGQTKEDALQLALLKTLIMLESMPDGTELEGATDAPALLKGNRLRGVYHFGSPFYCYAKPIARNTLSDLLCKECRERIVSKPVEDLAEVLSDPSQALCKDEEWDASEEKIQQLRIDLKLLMDAIETQLTAKPRRVIWLTLAARPKFWLALSITGLPPPDGVTHLPDSTTDSELAQMLATNVNAVRAHRSQAKGRIEEFHPDLRHLLAQLLAAR